MKLLSLKLILFVTFVFGFNSFIKAQYHAWYDLVLNNNTSYTLRVQLFDAGNNLLCSVTTLPNTSNTQCGVGSGIGTYFIIDDNGGSSCNVTVNSPWWVGGLPFSCTCTKGPSNWIASSGTTNCYSPGPPLIPNKTITVNAQ